MRRCPDCGSLRLLAALDGTTGFCARCHRRLSEEYVTPLFVGSAPIREFVGRHPTGPHPAA
jgi:uncharacterized paraquat-inducible protein A